jgi:hypothetical protein
MSIALQNRIRSLEARVAELEARILGPEPKPAPLDIPRPTLTLPKNDQRRTASPSR